MPSKEPVLTTSACHSLTACICTGGWKWNSSAGHIATVKNISVLMLQPAPRAKDSFFTALPASRISRKKQHSSNTAYRVLLSWFNSVPKLRAEHTEALWSHSHTASGAHVPPPIPPHFPFVPGTHQPCPTSELLDSVHFLPGASLPRLFAQLAPLTRFSAQMSAAQTGRLWPLGQRNQRHHQAVLPSQHTALSKVTLFCFFVYCSSFP